MADLVDALSAFRGKRVLITGNTGFKGSWLSLWLTLSGADVYGYALPPEREDSHFYLLRLGEKMTHEDGDIRDYDHFAAYVSRVRPEFVFHLAAQALVRRSYQQPKVTFDTNIGGSVNVLECVRHTPSVRALVYITSDKCYTNNEWLWGYREIDELGGHDPYGASKAAAEIVFAAYLDSFLRSQPMFGAASTRAGNVIGGGDWSTDRIVPDCINALLKSQPIILRNPQAIRPWQHVLEPLSGYLLLAVKLAESPSDYSGSWNLGPRNESVRTVRDMAERVVQCWGKGEIREQLQANAVHEDGTLLLNCEKAHRKLGWRPTWDFDRGVAETVSWYRRVTGGESADKVSSQQILSYMESRS